MLVYETFNGKQKLTGVGIKYQLCRSNRQAKEAINTCVIITEVEMDDG
ncbi:hypothetical protein LCGC14_2690720, partial [marine sediment metagenome]